MSHRVAAEPSAPPTRRRAKAVRTDIQALRALAVAMVLAYHLWPHGLTGGFTGVDAFFVISGFLITSHLLARPPGSIGDLLGFWSRRIRRLLPAALLVLAVTLAGSRLLAPDTQWENTARQSRAAALYVVNWRLAHDAVDYLASQNAPTPVQHFWSLSVEEQFYLIWPVLILVLALAGRRIGRPAGVMATGLAVVSGASLWYSVHETAVDPARAYFVTPTRIWELGAGGVLAAAVIGRRGELRRGSPRVRSSIAVAGFAAVLAGGVLYGPGTSFPSWHALLPVLGTVAVIAARAPDTGVTTGRLLAARPVQWLGDVSYSLYLWHWPLLVLAPDLVHHSLNTLDRLAVLVASLLLAGLTKPLVEDRFRRPSWGRPLIKPYALGAAAMALVVGITILQMQEVQDRNQQAAQALQHRLAQVDAPLPTASTPAPTKPVTGSSSGTNPSAIPSPTLPRSCFGAAALTPAFHCTVATRSGQLTPSPLRAAHDRSDAYGNVSGKRGCFAYAPAFATITCTRGDVHGTVRVALVGNSHAGQWLPAVDRAAEGLHWRVTTYLASQCAFARTSQRFPTSADTRGCNDWTSRVTAELVRRRFDLVVVTNRISVGAVGLTKAASGPAYQRGYASVLRSLAAAHLHVVGLRDTPAPGEIVPDCLAAHSSNYLACAGTRSAWLPSEPLLRAINSLHDARVIAVDLTDRICERRLCPAVVGGVPVYFDGSHLTATYSVTLAPYLAPYLIAALHAP